MKNTWTIRRSHTGKSVGTLESESTSDSIAEYAIRLFGTGIHLVLKSGDFRCVTEQDGMFNDSYMCQHHDDGTVSYVPAIVRPWPEEEFGNVTYEF